MRGDHDCVVATMITGTEGLNVHGIACGVMHSALAVMGPTGGLRLMEWGRMPGLSPRPRDMIAAPILACSDQSYDTNTLINKLSHTSNHWRVSDSLETATGEVSTRGNTSVLLKSSSIVLTASRFDAPIKRTVTAKTRVQHSSQARVRIKASQPQPVRCDLCGAGVEPGFIHKHQQWHQQQKSMKQQIMSQPPQPWMNETETLNFYIIPN